MGLFDDNGNDFQFSDFNLNLNRDSDSGLTNKNMFDDLYGKETSADFGFGEAATPMPEMPAELEFYQNSSYQVRTINDKVSHNHYQ